MYNFSTFCLRTLAIRYIFFLFTVAIKNITKALCWMYYILFLPKSGESRSYIAKRVEIRYGWASVLKGKI